MADKVTWTGASGTQYVYSVYSLNTNWNDVPGNYIFARQVTGGWTAIYIGETESFKRRPLGPGHEAWDCARRHHMTHVHARTNTGGTAARRREETDLLANRNPPCNG